jgi:hypothetical protein
MVDDDRLEGVGHAVADRVLDAPGRIDRVVLTRLDEGRVVAVRD